MKDPEDISARILLHNFGHKFMKKEEKSFSSLTKKLLNIDKKVQLFSKIFIKIGRVQRLFIELNEAFLEHDFTRVTKGFMDFDKFSTHFTKIMSQLA